MVKRNDFRVFCMNKILLLTKQLMGNDYLYYIITQCIYLISLINVILIMPTIN